MTGSEVEEFDSKKEGNIHKCNTKTVLNCTKIVKIIKIVLHISHHAVHKGEGGCGILYRDREERNV